MRTFVLLTTLIVLVVAPPLAAASDACMAMSGACEGPCGTASCTAVIRVPDAILPVTANLVVPTQDDVPNVPLRLPELPPRPRLRLA